MHVRTANGFQAVDCRLVMNFKVVSGECYENIKHPKTHPMSRASKITLALSCLLTTTTVVGVHIVQDMERQTLHQGPIKDAKRVAEKKLAKEEQNQDPSKQRMKLVNKGEHELQQELRKKYEAMQPLSGEVLTKDGEVVKK